MEKEAQTAWGGVTLPIKMQTAGVSLRTSLALFLDNVLDIKTVGESIGNLASPQVISFAQMNSYLKNKDSRGVFCYLRRKQIL